MNQWEWFPSQPLVSGEEVLLTSQQGVALYDGNTSTEWEGGKLSLSTHHLIYEPANPTNKSSAGKSTVMALRLALERVHKSGTSPSIVKGRLFSSDKIVVPLPANTFVKLSFRSSGMAPFYDALVAALAKKHWARTAAPPPTTQARSDAPSLRGAAAPGPSSAPKTAGMLGIAGIMKTSNESAKMQTGTFQDIDDVMNKASTLVNNIRQLKQRANASPQASNDADTLALESIEATLGLGTLVRAQDHRKSKSGNSFHAELAKELHAWMVHPRNAQHFSLLPIVPLIELFSLYNKARSGDLISPEDVLSACKEMSAQSYSSYRFDKLASGRYALVHKDTSLVLGRLAPLLGPRLIAASAPAPTKGTVDVPITRSPPTSSAQLKTTTEVEVSTVLRLSAVVAKDLLDSLTTDGFLCVSDAGFGCTSYHWNVFCFAG